EVAVRGIRTITVGADVAGDVAHAPVAAGPLVVQRGAGGREALQADLVGAAVDRVLVLPARLQQVGQPAGAAQVEVGPQRQVHAVGLDFTLVEVAVVDLDHGVAAVGIATQRARSARHGGRVVAVVDVDQLLRAEVGDALLDLDVPVVDRHVQPVGRVPDHAERVLGRLFRTQALGLLAVGVNLVAAGPGAQVDVRLA